MMKYRFSDGVAGGELAVDGDDSTDAGDAGIGSAGTSGCVGQYFIRVG
jgi:hypothetical protein